MALKISADSTLPNHYLIVQSDGVAFSGGASAERWFRFADVHCILLSADGKLSFQVGKEVFSIPTDPANEKHQAVIAAFVQAAQHAGAGWSADHPAT